MVRMIWKSKMVMPSCLLKLHIPLRSSWSKFRYARPTALPNFGEQLTKAFCRACPALSMCPSVEHSLHAHHSRAYLLSYVGSHAFSALLCHFLCYSCALPAAYKVALWHAASTLDVWCCFDKPAPFGARQIIDHDCIATHLVINTCVLQWVVYIHASLWPRET